MSTLGEDIIDSNSEYLRMNAGLMNPLEKMKPLVTQYTQMDRFCSGHDGLLRSSSVCVACMDDSFDGEIRDSVISGVPGSVAGGIVLNDKIVRYSSGTAASSKNNKSPESNNGLLRCNTGYDGNSEASVGLHLNTTTANMVSKSRNSVSALQASTPVSAVLMLNTALSPMDGSTPTGLMSTPSYDENHRMSGGCLPFYASGAGDYYDVYGEHPHLTVAADAPFVDMCGVDELPQPPSKLGATWRRLHMLEDICPDESTATSRNELIEFDVNGKVLFDNLSQTDTINTHFTTNTCVNDPQTEYDDYDD